MKSLFLKAMYFPAFLFWVGFVLAIRVAMKFFPIPGLKWSWLSIAMEINNEKEIT